MATTTGERKVPKLIVTVTPKSSRTKIHSYATKSQPSSTTRTPSFTRTDSGNSNSSSKLFRPRTQKETNKSQTPHNKTSKSDAQRKKTNKTSTPKSKSKHNHKVQNTRNKSKASLRNKSNKPKASKSRNKNKTTTPTASTSKKSHNTPKSKARTPKPRPHTPKKTQTQRPVRRSKYFPTPAARPQRNPKSRQKTENNKKIRSKTPSDHKRHSSSPRLRAIKKTAQNKRATSPKQLKLITESPKSHQSTGKHSFPSTPLKNKAKSTPIKHKTTKNKASNSNAKDRTKKWESKTTKTAKNKQLKSVKSSTKTSETKGKQRLSSSPSLHIKSVSSGQIQLQSTGAKLKTSRSLKANYKASPNSHKSSTLRKPAPSPPRTGRCKVPNTAAPKRPTHVHYRTKTLQPIKKSKNKRSKTAKKVHKVAYTAPGPIFQHPTIGEYYSKAVRKKKLIQRELPAIPKDICIYFALMGNIYKYTITIRLHYELSQILAKLSPMLALNEEILGIIHRQLGQYNLKKSNGSTYDLIINNPIFIYRNETYDGSETFDSIGFTHDFEEFNAFNEEEQYIAVLSCTGSDNSASVSRARGHFRSRTHNDIPTLSPYTPSKSPSISMSQTPSKDMQIPGHSPSLLGSFGSLSNLANALNMQKNHSTDSLFSDAFDDKNDPRFKALKHCVENLGYSLSSDVNKQELIAFVNESIDKMSDECTEELKDNDPKQKKKRRKRGRSRSWAGMKIEIDDISRANDNKNKKTNENTKTNSHHRYNASVPDMTIDTAMLRLDLSSIRTHRATLDIIDDRVKTGDHKKTKSESRFSRLFKRPFGKKKTDQNATLSPVLLNKSLSAEVMDDAVAALDEEKTFEKDVDIIDNTDNEENKHKKKQKQKQKQKQKHKMYTIRDKHGQMKTISRSNGSTVTITRRSSGNKNQIKATLIVEGYLNVSDDNIKWKKLYFTMNRDRLLCWYANKNCDLAEPMDTLSLSHGHSSFNINTYGTAEKKQLIAVTVKRSVSKYFKGTIASLEKWKRAFLF